jgi:S-adenosylmethionine hydrolase
LVVLFFLFIFELSTKQQTMKNLKGLIEANPEVEVVEIEDGHLIDRFQERYTYTGEDMLGYGFIALERRISLGEGKDQLIVAEVSKVSYQEPLKVKINSFKEYHRVVDAYNEIENIVESIEYQEEYLHKDQYETLLELLEESQSNMKFSLKEFIKTKN